MLATQTGRLDGGDPAAPVTELGDARGDQDQDSVVLAQVVRLGAASASLAAATIHASAIAEHTFDLLHVGAFVSMAVFQAWWAYLVLRSTSARTLITGAIGHGSIVALWLLTRLSSAEWLPGVTGREAAGLKDLTATALAIMVLGSVDVLSRRDVSSRRVRGTSAGAAVATFVLVAALLGAVGSFTTGHVHGSAGTGDDTSHDHS